MRPIWCFGEALIDFLADRPAAGEAPRYTQFPGGAPANVAVAVARLGGDARFVGKLARDPFGDFLAAELRRYGVNLDAAPRTDEGPTALAFVTLDAHGERGFAFRRDGTADLAFRAGDFAQIDFAGGGAFHFCSNTLTHAPVAEATRAGAARARAAGCVVSFDVNLRPALWPRGRDARAAISDLLVSADVVKVSREELDFLRDGRDESRWVEDVLRTARLVVVTDGPRPAVAWTRGGRVVQPAPTVTVRDTTGAGDAFSGGLLFALARADLDAAGLERGLAAPGFLPAALRFAVACGAHAVTRAGAFPSFPDRAEAEGMLARVPEAS